MIDAFVRSVVLMRDEVEDFDTYPFSIPAIRALSELELDSRLTLLAGENGSGKSTLVEAIAVAVGFNPEGGSRNFAFATRSSHSPLHERLRVVRGTRSPRTGYFLRAESFFNVAAQIEELDREPGGPPIIDAYGGVSLHEQSHGEPLSLRGNLALMRRIHDLAGQGAQFIVSTHSPILLGYPNARIYLLSEQGISETSYEETEQYALTRSFLNDRDRFLHYLFTDD